MSDLELRDYFAMAALQGLLSSEPVSPEYEFEDGNTVAKRFAKDAFFLADAMLKARLTTKKQE